MIDVKSVCAKNNDLKELPIKPVYGGSYGFNNIARKDIVGNNHGIHKYPAKFIPQIPRWGLFYERNKDHEVVFDPFCGSGTTLVESGLIGNHTIGYDISPLAVLISKAKTANLGKVEIDISQFLENVQRMATDLYQDFESELSKNRGTECFGMHRTWSNWFRPTELSRLIALRESISLSTDSDELKSFAYACLSSIVKSSSYLCEDQIKVRYVSDKKLIDPFVAFFNLTSRSIDYQLILSKKFNNNRSSFEVVNKSCSELLIEDTSVDRVITSPPYINAVDYTMTHKYNMFVLGLLDPGEFKSHCREYIGVTERAVVAADLKEKPFSCNNKVNKEVSELWNIGTSTSKNRAFVVAQYFNGMQESFKEIYRVLKPGGKYVFVIGEDNNICKRRIMTAELLEGLAIESGFRTILKFYHNIANRSSMRLQRSDSGGSIKREVVYVFSKD